jgi:hypothetical protein
MIEANLVLDFILKIKLISLTLSSLVIFVQIVLISICLLILFDRQKQ